MAVTIRCGIRRRLGILLCAAISACAQPSLDRHVSRPADVAFVDVAVVDVRSGTVVPRQTVLVHDGRISGRGAVAAIAIPPGATVVNGTGRYLLPGLIDAHVHHFESDKGYGERELALFLAKGVTTVRVMRGTERALSARERQRAGTLLSPRLVVCSPHVSGSRNTPPDSLADAVRRYTRLGYDCIKIYSGPSPAAFAAAVDAADSAGIPTAGHASTRLPFGHVLRLGSIEHIEEIQWFFGRRTLNEREHGKRLDSLAASGKPVVTTVGGFDFGAHLRDEDYGRLLARESSRYVTREGLRERASFIETQRRRGVSMDSLERAFDGMYLRALHYARAFHDRGVTLVMGTDAGNGLSPPGFSAHDELETLVRAGLSPAQALATGTEHGAALLKLPAGQIEAGRLADLLLLRANPLDDITAVRQIDGVMAGTRWLDRSAVDAILSAMRRR